MLASLRSPRLVCSTLLLAAAAACSSDSATGPRGPQRVYGAAQAVGNGTARTYTVLDTNAAHTPLELGIALSADALQGLPSSQEEYSYLLPLPASSPAPYQLVELDWNPHGHPPAGVYDVPHFDFHFYTITKADRDAIVPTDPNFAAEANNVPTGDSVPPYYAVPGKPSDVAVPMMGVHWSDMRSPELQNILGHPELYQPFTKTFIYGSWNGRFTFFEPMITLAYLQSQPDVTTAIPVPQKYPEAGWFPTSYRVTYDAQAKEYRVALTGLAQAQ